MLDDRRQIIRSLGIQQLVVGQRSRRDDPDDVALDQPLGQPGVFNLLANGGTQARPGRSSPDSCPGRGGESPPSARRHRPYRATSAPAPERRCPFGVIAEHLVEIAHPKQQKRIRVAGLELAILLHHRGQQSRSWMSRGLCGENRNAALGSQVWRRFEHQCRKRIVHRLSGLCQSPRAFAGRAAGCQN